MPFMSAAEIEIDGTPILATRSGYTGEDGYELSVPGDKGAAIARLLLKEPEVAPIGLGARDSLRLEAGLCLYGHDIDTETNPVEADLLFVLGKRRREEGGFPGAERILADLKDGPRRKRVGLVLQGRAPAREGAQIVDANGEVIGLLTSGGFGPSAEKPVAMGYVPAAHAEPGTKLGVVVRGKTLEAEVVKTPFVEQRYYRAKK
jgi:aminomethyltransferase